MNLASVKVLKKLNGVNSNVEISPWEKNLVVKVHTKSSTNWTRSRIDLKVLKFVFSFDVPI